MYTGIAISLAWPETLCKQAGAWYDGLMETLCFSKNHYYKVEHAAVILIPLKSGSCFYFDFGRYHAPCGQGRVRDHETDHDLKINAKANCDSDNNLLNLDEILNEVFQNEACHGSGILHASFAKVNFEKAFITAKTMQEESPHPYGPFIAIGTNCSRFVRSIILSGRPELTEKIKLFFPKTISPMPIGNVTNLKGYKTISHIQKTVKFTPDVLKEEICQTSLSITR